MNTIRLLVNVSKKIKAFKYDNLPHKTLKETEEGLVTWHLSAPLGKYGLFLKSNSELIGNINFRPETNEKVFIGYTLNKNFWKLEYATEALQKLISLSFKQLGIKQILAKVHSENRASITFLLKLGFSLWLILKVISNTIGAMLLMS